MMEWQDYKNDVQDAAENFIYENYDSESLPTWDKMQTALLWSDQVTGQASGSYTCDADEASENIQGVLYNVWVLNTLAGEYGWGLNLLANGPEYVDVCIRLMAADAIMPDLLRYYLDLLDDGPYYACPTCSTDQYGHPIDEVILTRHGDSYQCPRCGCSTTAPLEDGCWVVC